MTFRMLNKESKENLEIIYIYIYIKIIVVEMKAL